MSAPRKLTEDEKWGRAVADQTYGLVRPRAWCEHGSVYAACGRYANWRVGRKKLCGQHAKAAVGGVTPRP